MPSNSLQKLLKPKGSLYPVLVEVLRPYSDAAAVFDASGQLLFGCANLPPGERHPIESSGQAVGWVQVRSPSAVSAAALARFFGFLMDQEADKKALTGELIDRYRELSLLYHLSERLAAAPHPESIARQAIEETLRTIPAGFGLILLKKPDGAFDQIALQERSYQLITARGLVERVLASGRAELANDLPGSEYLQDPYGPSPEIFEHSSISLLCAPLKTEKNMLGVIVLVDKGERSFTAGDLKLLNTIAMQAAPAIEISRLYQMALEKARIERELQMARQVQESLLPAGMPRIDGWAFATRWRPAREVSGDFYDVIDEEDGRLGLMIGDVTDKGMPASLFMVFVRSALRASIRRSSNPAEAMSYANQLICRDSRQGLFTTLFYARLQIETGEVQYVNAGHNPPLFYHAQTGDLRLLARTGLPLGINENMQYRFQNVRLDPGDFILFYTDGFTEATNPAHEEFGLERLQQAAYALCGSTPDQIIDRLEANLAQFIDSTPVGDDITLTVMKRM